MSLSMLARTPGYWIFSAKAWPPCVCAQCTTPIEAAAMGAMSKLRNRLCQCAPYSRFSTAVSCAAGMVWAALRSPPNKLENSAGNTPWPAASIDISWPTFITAPRMADKRSAIRLALAGVKIGCARSDLSP